jgi:hypothetical protein
MIMGQNAVGGSYLLDELCDVFEWEGTLAVTG